MTATMDYNTELISIQNELKKYIFHHQMLRLNNGKKSEDFVKAKLVSFENKIVELSKRQKLVINNLRKERLNASKLDHQLIPNKSIYLNNQTTILKQRTNSTYQNQDKQQLQIRSSFNNNNKLLVPVSAAAATSKKINHQQILVVPTPGGGARLATTSTNTSRSTLNKSSTNGYSAGGSSLITPNKTQLNNFTITNTTKPINTSASLSTNLRLMNDKSNNTTVTNGLLAGELTKITSVKRKNSNVQPVEKSPPRQELVITQVNKLEPKIDETKAKEEFLFKLGLVTKQALSEIQNKKSERKRRTTANPQFSNAAIEAKRISAQEMAAKKAKKRELAASIQESVTNNSTANKQQKSILNTNRSNKVVGGSKQDRKSAVPKVSNNNGNKKISQNNEFIKISSNCFVCNEVCDSDLDEIMFCDDCHCLFHATCSSTVDHIKKTMGVPCPKCESKRSLAEQLPNLNPKNEDRNILKQKAIDSSNSNSSSIVSSGKTNSSYRRRLDKSRNGQNRNSKFVSNNNNLTKNEQTPNKTGKVLTENSKTLTEPKSDEERYKFLQRYEQLDRQVRDFRVKLALLKDKVYSSKESRREMLVKKENSKRSIDSIVNLVKKIQECNCEQKENQQTNNRSANQCDLEVTNEVILDSEPTIISNELIVPNQNEHVEILNEVTLNEEVASNNEDNESLSKIQKEQQLNELEILDETDVVVNNSNLIIVNNELKNETNDNQSNDNKINDNEVDNVQKTVQKINVREEIDEILEKQKIKVENKKPEEMKIGFINNQQSNSNQTEKLIIKTELINETESINTDEPPTKKLRLSPAKEEIKEEFEIYQVSQDLDEVSAAIASIQ